MHYHAEVFVPTKKNYQNVVAEIMAPHYEKWSDNDEESREGFWDWYVIGGRWSGRHTILDLYLKYGDEAYNAMLQEFKERFGWWEGGPERITRETRKAQFEEVFHKHFPDANLHVPMPAWRDSYKQDGYPDDICALEDIPIPLFSCYTLILPSGVYHREEWTGDRFEEQKHDFPALLSGLTGYLVTVDYHN